MQINVNHHHKLIDVTELTNQVAGEQGILVFIHGEGMIDVTAFY